MVFAYMLAMLNMYQATLCHIPKDYSSVIAMRTTNLTQWKKLYFVEVAETINKFPVPYCKAIMFSLESL
jgi:hypothetical protein